MVATPSADSEINIEVWLPMSGWNGRYQAVGAGGLAGSIPFGSMASALASGYAASGTDTGHRGGNASFMPDYPEKLTDFAYRSTHEMAVAAKLMIDVFYGKPPSFSYFDACSGGGRQGLASAQRYPEDFDGIVAGAPSWNQARLDAARIAINLIANRTAEAQILHQYPMIHDAVLTACDGLDGVKDGIIANPPSCRFDYARLACNGENAPGCLTPPQIASARALTSSLTDPRSGAALFGPHLWPGVEREWGTLGGPQPLTNAVDRVRRFHLKDPAFQFRLDNIAEFVERADKMDNGLLATRNVDLKPFFSQGGKLLMWHGWDDDQVPAESSIHYYENVRKAVGRLADDGIALFLLPGVSHCSGGAGPDTFGRMQAIEQWVEKSVTPARLMAERMSDGKVQMRRPICAYPQVPQFQGAGDTSNPDDFVCRMMR